MNLWKLVVAAAAAAAVVALLALPVSARSADATVSGSRGGPTVTVMTHNLYFGTDLTPAITATSGPAFLAAVGSAYTEAMASNVPARAEAWADEIARAQPDLVGLQEAVVWREELTSDFLGTLDANIVTADFVAELQSALARHGLDYRVASEATGYDVEAPGLFPPATINDVRLTMHDVILVRDTASLKTTNPQHGQYAAQLALPLVSGQVVNLPWSWASVDVTYRGRSFRFATTHLDSDVGPYQEAQAHEFLVGPGSTSLPLVWVGDFNSDAGATAITGVPPATATHSEIVAAGLTDTWAAVHPGDPGYTCCHSEDLRDNAPLNQRIDYVFTRGGFIPLQASLSTGRTPDGLWDSDHDGLVATLQLPSQN
jgi:endonuclease/exonuclease/phosphatase family metal-dependent hydrolase